MSVIFWIPAVGRLDTPLREGLPHGDLLYLGCAILLPPPAFARAGGGAVMALDTLWQDHASERATPPLFIVSHSCLRPRRTAHQKEERMNTVSQQEIIGLDVSRDWLDLHCLSDSRQLRLPNTDAGHAALERMALDRTALVCVEAAGGHEWRLWERLEAAGVDARQLPPAQIKSFGKSRGTLAKTDRIDAELIARFMAFRPEAGRRLPRETLRGLRALTTKRRQLVDMRKRHALHCKADQKTGAACEFEDIDADLREVLDRRIKDLEQRIKTCLDSDGALSETAAVLRSVPGIGLVACAMPVAEMPELGRISGEQAAALAGLAPVARDSGQMRGKRMIGGRRALRCVLYQAALVASIHNADLKVFADRLRKEGKPHKLVAAAVARKLVVIANALCKSRQPWMPQTG